MTTIHLLDQDTINKIAAGEVVERPLSVVKECVENAIDAKANAITVEIEDGGLKTIRITDNGVGMSGEDVKAAFLRHATSKIIDADDLDHIRSLGFRGEALASIAAVSMVECITKQEEELTGIRYVIEGGLEKEVQDIGCPSGTTFVIRELFYNVPARKKFLKTPRTEAGYITDLIHRLALSHPGISFKYIVNKNVKLHTSGNYSLLDCIYQVFGKEHAKQSKEVDYSYGDYSVTGYIGEPELSRGNRQYEIYYVNNRYIKSKWIQDGIEEGFKEAMMINQFPFAVLFLKCPTELLDINVHPTKMQARFNDEMIVREIFKDAVIHTLRQKEPIVDIELQEKRKKTEEEHIEKKEYEKLIKEVPEPFETKRRESFSTLQEKNLPDKAIIPSEPEKRLEPAKKPEPISMDLFLDEQKIQKHRVIGQVFKTYWLVEYHKELYIIDQHAAHEKVLYESWVSKIEKHTISSQMLLESKVYTLSDREFEMFQEHQQAIADLGFDVEEFGGNSIILKSVPYLLNEPLTNMDFIHFFDQLAQGVKYKKQERYLHDLATIACKAAIKGNDQLSLVEYQSLIHQLLQLDDPYHCPHGRPTMIRMSLQELEKKFKRIV
jgi:DNA mismatch repair protein MutL